MQANGHGDVVDSAGVAGFMEPATSADIQRFDREEQEGLELAFEIAATDSTEKDHLAASPGVAYRRFERAAVELLHSGLALMASLVGRLLLASAARAVHKRGTRKLGRRKMSPVQLSVLSLEELLEGPGWRRPAGRVRTLRMLGARWRVGEDGTKVVSLKLAERRYRSGCKDSGLGYTTAADAPVVRVMLGVSMRGKEKPVHRVRRFMEVEPGRFTEMAGYHAADAEDAFIEYLSNLSVEQMNEERDGEEAAGSQNAEPPENGREDVRAA